MSEKERRLQELYNKTAMNKQFKTVKQRNEWIDKQLKEINNALKTFNTQKTQNEKEIEKLEKEMKEKEKEIEEKEKEIEHKKKEIESTNSSFTLLKNQRDTEANERKDKWKLQNEIKQSIHSLDSDLSKFERQIQSNTNKLIISGINNVKLLQQKYNISGNFFF